MAEKQGVHVKRCSDFHFQLKGYYLVNVYPSRKTFYVQGTNRKSTYKELKQLIAISLGETDLKIAKDRVERKSLGHLKPRLWQKSKRCFVCGRELASIDQATIEHKIPLFRGGSNRRDNLALSHETCNIKRGNSLAVTRDNVAFEDLILEKQ